MSLTYHKLEWIHDFEDEPGLFYFEVGDDRYATRSIEVFEDGRTVRASEEDLERDPMALPDQPVLAVEEKIDASRDPYVGGHCATVRGGVECGVR